MKILVTVSIPAISAQYDILVPNDLRIKTIASLIADSVEDLSDHKYISSGEECLCYKEKSIIMKNNSTLKRYGVQNGDHIIIM